LLLQRAYQEEELQILHSCAAAEIWIPVFSFLGAVFAVQSF
jgi:hypothetical protein